MIRGLVIGKFMPVHKGHIALINFAAAQCDELIVSMSYTDNDPVSFQLRFNWLQEIFADQLNIQPHLIKDDFDNELLPLNERTKIWAKKMQQQYPPIHIIFSSENYGQPFAENMQAKHVPFDAERINVAVASTLIRAKPLTYWNYIPQIVQPYFVKKICFYGPESTGKTYMSKLMSAHYKTNWVPEAAREILTSNEFSDKEILQIALMHDECVNQQLQTANKLLFCDTDVITTQIYAQHYLSLVPQMLFDIEKKTRYDLYFLMNIDTPWIEDPLRDLGNRRAEMFSIFKAALDKRNIPYILIEGDHKQREEAVISELNKLLEKF